MAKRKRLNRRALIVLSILGGLVVLGGVAYWIKKLPKDPAPFIAEAEAAMEADPPDYESAMRNYQIALGHEGNNPNVDHMYRLSEIAMERAANDPTITPEKRRSTRQMAIQYLHDCIVRDASYLKAREDLSDYYFAMARHLERWDLWKQTIDHLDAIIAQEPSANMYFRRGIAKSFLARSDPKYQDQALDDLREAIEQDRENTDYWLQLARYLEALERPEQAEEIYRQALDALPGNARIRVQYARLLQRLDRNEEALEKIRQAVRAEPDSAEGLIALAQYTMGKGELDKTEELLDQALQIDPTEVRIYDLQATVARRRNDLPKAIQSIRNGLDALQERKPDNTAMRQRIDRARAVLNYLLANNLLDLSQSVEQDQRDPKLLAEAREAHNILRKLAPDDGRQYAIAGRLAMAEEDWASARKSLEQAMETGGNIAAANQLIEVYNKLGLPGRAEALVDRILKMPSHVNNTYFLLRKAQYRLNARDYDLAGRLIRQVLESEPDNALALRLKRAHDVAIGKVTEVAGGENEQDHRIMRMMVTRRAQELMMSGKTDEALKLMEALHEQDPDDLGLFVQLTQLRLEAGQRDRAISEARRMIQAHSDNEQLKHMVSLLEERDPQKRFELEIKYTDTYEDPLTRALIRYRLCQRYDKKDQAESFLQEARNIDPQNPFVIRTAFEHALQKRDWAGAEAIINDLKKRQDDMASWYQARLKVARGEFEQAIPYIQETLKAIPHMLSARLLMAGCYVETDQLPRAKDEYETILANQTTHVQAMIGLAKIAQHQGRTEDHRRWVRQAHQQPAGQADPYIREWYLRLIVEPNDPRAAIAQRENLLTRNPDNLDNTFRLANLYEEDRQYDKAEQLLLQVYAKAADKVALVPTVANFFVRRDHTSRADKLFVDLLKETTDPQKRADIYIAYANFLSETDPGSAEGMYQKALDAAPKYPEGYQALGNFYARQAQTLESRGFVDRAKVKWKQSVGMAEKSLDLDPDSRQAGVILNRRLIDAGLYDRAMKGFQALRNEDPDDVAVHVGLGLCHLRQNQLDRAMKQFNRALEIDPNSPDALVFRSEIYRSRGMYFEAVRDIERALSIRSNVQLMMDRGLLYRSMGDMESAQRAFDHVIARYPDYLPAYRNLMELFAIQQKWVPLDRLAKVGMEQFPQSPYFPMMVARRWDAADRQDLKIRWLQRAVQIAPNDVSLIRQWMEALIQAEQWAQVQALTNQYASRPEHAAGIAGLQALAAARSNPDAQFDIKPFLKALDQARADGDILYLLKLIEQAGNLETLLAHSADIIQVTPQTWQIHYGLGNALLRARRFERARQRFERALELCKIPPSRSAIQSNLAHVYEGMKQYDQAARQYEAMLQRDRYNVPALNNLAYLYADKLGEPAKALPYIERAMRLQPGDSNLVDTYAWTLAQMGKYLKARDALQDLPQFKSPLSAGPTSVDATYHLGYVLEKTGDLPGALRYYRQAHEMLKNQPAHPLYETVTDAVRRVERKTARSAA
jgi:tetratricopeptide (TPR) repeat protein